MCVQTSAQQRFSLDEAVQYALDHSIDKQIQLSEISRAAEDIKDFRSIGMPKVDAGVDYSYYFQVPLQPVEDFIGPAVYNVLFEEGVLQRRDLGAPEVFEFGFIQPHNLTGRIQASSLIFSGSYIYGLRAAKAYRDLVSIQTEATDQKIRGDVTKAYASVLIAAKNKDIIANNIKTIDASILEVSAMYEAGFAEQLDVDRLSLTKNKLDTEFTKLDQVIEVMKNLLKFQMGFPIEEDLELSETLESIELKMGYSSADQPGIDYTKRAMYNAAVKGQELNELNLKANRAGYLPTASVFASHQQSLQRTNLFDNDEAGWLPTSVVGISIGVPIYDGGEKSAKIQKVRLDMAKADLMIQSLERAITMEVRNAQLSLKNAEADLANSKKAMEISESIFDKTRIKFKEGVGSSVEVTQAEGQLFDAQAQYLAALFDLVNAKIDLDIALGNR